MNDTTFQGNGKITYVPVVVNAKPPKQTNADRIRGMSDEELAVLLANTEANFPPNFPNGVSVKLCTTSWLDWLKEAKE